jgi:hypothetical protein
VATVVAAATAAVAASVARAAGAVVVVARAAACPRVPVAEVMKTKRLNNQQTLFPVYPRAQGRDFSRDIVSHLVVGWGFVIALITGVHQKRIICFLHYEIFVAFGQARG